MSLVQEALGIWYNGLGQTLVGVTCPLHVGLLIMVLLFVVRGRAEAEAKRTGKVKRHRPAYLLRRIILAPSMSWISIAFACSLMSIAYVWTLVILSKSDMLARKSVDSYETQCAALVLLWLAIFGLVLAIFNFLSVLRIPVDALYVRGVWLTIRQFPADKKQVGNLYLAIRTAQVYSDGQVSLGSRYHLAQLFHSFHALACRAIAKQRAQGASGQLNQPFFILERKGEDWRINVPQGLDDQPVVAVLVHRPMRDMTRVSRGERATIWEGDRIQWEGEDWYILVEKLHPRAG